MKIYAVIECRGGTRKLAIRLARAAGTPIEERADRATMAAEMAELDSDRISPETVPGIWRQLHDRVCAMNGLIASVDSESGESLSLKNAYYLDEVGQVRWLPITATGWTVLPALNSGPESRVAEAEAIARCARLEPTVSKVLRLLQKDHDWTNLSRILELIEKDVGGRGSIAERGWATKADLESVAGSANDPRVSGDDSRHGVASGSGVSRPMDLRQARHIVTRLAKSWLLDRSQD